MSRKIEDAMIAAIRAGENFKQGNTEVVQISDHVYYFDHAEVRLHGNVIARVMNNGADGKWTLAGWNTATTRSRINALVRAFNWDVGVRQVGDVAFKTGSATKPFAPISSTEWINAF